MATKFELGAEIPSPTGLSILVTSPPHCLLFSCGVTWVAYVLWGEGVRMDGGYGGHTVVAHGCREPGQAPRPCTIEGARGMRDRQTRSVHYMMMGVISTGGWGAITSNIWVGTIARLYSLRLVNLDRLDCETYINGPLS